MYDVLKIHWNFVTLFKYLYIVYVSVSFQVMKHLDMDN